MRQGRGRAWWGLLVVAATAGDLTVAPTDSAWAAGSLKITAIRTDGDYGDAAWIVFPNGRNLQLDGGADGVAFGDPPVIANTKLTQYLDLAIGNGGTIWYMALSHGHLDHLRGLNASLTRYIVMRYYSSFPENDTPAQSLATTPYSLLTSALNTEFPTDYKTNVNCYEIVANASPGSTKKVSGPSGVNLGPGWDTSVDALVVSGEEMTTTINPNPNSVVYHIWYGSNTALSGGDAKGATAFDYEDVETPMVTNYGGTGGRIKNNVGLLKLHHHGSNDSSNVAFLDNIMPADPMRRYAYACNGDTSAASNYSFTMASRLYARSVTQYRTDLDGRARFGATGDGNWSLTRQYYYSEGGTADATHSDLYAPSAVGTLSATNQGANADLSWTAATPPAFRSNQAYDVYRSTLTGGIDIPFTSGEDPASANWRTGSVTGLYQKIARVLAPGTTHRDSGIGNNRYYYRIRAVHDYYFESDFSNQVGVSQTAPDPAPTGPTRTDREFFAVSGDSASTTTQAYLVYRIYANGAWSANASSTTGETSGAGDFYRIAACPVRGEYVSVYRQTGGASGRVLRVQVWNGGAWTSQTVVAQDASAALEQRSWDIAYEQTSGNCWVILRSSATGGTTSPVGYKWDGTAWASTGTIGSAWPASTIQWIRLVARPASNELTVVVGHANGSVAASVFNGTSWSAATTLTAVAPAGVGEPWFDAAYENSGECVVVWIEAATPDIIKSNSHTAGAWGTAATIAHGQTITDPISSIDLGAKPGADEILLVFNDDGASTTSEDANVGVWSGTAWGNFLNASIDMNGYSTLPRMPFSVTYNGAGTGYVTYAGSLAGTMLYRTWDGVGPWSAASAATPDIGADVDWVTAVGDPTSAATTVAVAEKTGTATNASKVHLLGTTTDVVVTGAPGGNIGASLDITVDAYTTWPTITVTAVPSVAAEIPTGAKVALIQIAVLNNNASRAIELFRVKTLLTSDGTTALTEGGARLRFDALALYEDTYAPDTTNRSFHPDQDTLIIRQDSSWNGGFSNGQVNIATNTTSGSSISAAATKYYWLVGEISSAGNGLTVVVSIDADGTTTDGGRVELRDEAADTIAKNVAATAVATPTLTIRTAQSPVSGYPVSPSAGSAIETGATLASDGSNWYVASSNGTVYKYSTAGAAQYNSGALSAFRCPVLFSQESGLNYLYVTSDTGILYKLQDTGAALSTTWSRTLNAAATFRTRPAFKTISAVGYVFVAGSDGLVYKCRADNTVAPVTVSLGNAVTGAGLTMNFEQLGGDVTNIPYWFGAEAGASLQMNKGNADTMAAPATVTVGTATSISAPMATFDNTRLFIGGNDAYIRSIDTGSGWAVAASYQADGGTVGVPFVTGRGAGSAVYFGTAGGVVYAKAPTLPAANVWRRSLGSAITTMPVPNSGLSATYVLVGTANGMLYLLNASDGTSVTNWPVATGGRVLGVMLYGGRVYASTDEGKVYAFAVP